MKIEEIGILMVINLLGLVCLIVVLFSDARQKGWDALAENWAKTKWYDNLNNEETMSLKWREEAIAHIKATGALPIDYTGENERTQSSVADIEESAQ